MPRVPVPSHEAVQAGLSARWLGTHDVARGGTALTLPACLLSSPVADGGVGLLAKQRLEPHFQIALFVAAPQ